MENTPHVIWAACLHCEVKQRKWLTGREIAYQMIAFVHLCQFEILYRQFESVLLAAFYCPNSRTFICIVKESCLPSSCNFAAAWLCYSARPKPCRCESCWTTTHGTPCLPTSLFSQVHSQNKAVTCPFSPLPTLVFVHTPLVFYSLSGTALVHGEPVPHIFKCLCSLPSKPCIKKKVALCTVDLGWHQWWR